jgi:uncharacterized protein YndB with AHSA1/START domain
MQIQGGIIDKKIFDIVQNIFISAFPERVFQALTDPDELKQWFLKAAEIDAREGGRFLLDWGGSKVESKIVKLSPNKLISFTWCTKCGEGPVVAFKLKRKQGGTVVTIEHKRFKQNGKGLGSLAGHIAGWSAFLCNLKCFVERGWDLRKDQPEEITSVLT